MRKVILLIFSAVLILSGCSNDNVSSKFTGIPIYPGTELISRSEMDSQVAEIYADESFTDNIEEVKSFFEDNIDKDVWWVKALQSASVGVNTDKVYIYRLTSKENVATLTITYKKSSKTEARVDIAIIGSISK